MNINELIASDDIESSIIEMHVHICELCVYCDGLDKLTDPQKNFHYNQLLEAEINNGGFNQYFFNSSGAHAYKTVLSLKLINAHKTAALLQAAIDEFPYKTVPEDNGIRQQLVDDISEQADEVWNELDQRFYVYEEDLNALNMEYIKANLKDFS